MLKDYLICAKKVIISGEENLEIHNRWVHFIVIFLRNMLQVTFTDSNEKKS